MAEATISIVIGTTGDDDGEALDRGEVATFLSGLNDLLRHADAPFRVGTATVSYK